MKYRTLFFIALALIVVGMGMGFLAIQKLGGWKYTAHRLHTLEAWPTYTQRLSQLELLPIDSASVVFLGDSHAAFGEWHEWLPNITIANKGIPGEGIQGLCAFAKTNDLSEAALIVVQIGTNDLLFHDPDAVKRLYQKMVEQLSQLNRPVVYCTLPGVNNDVRWTGIDACAVASLNTYILSLRDSGHHILDLAAALNTASGVLPKGLTDDGVHLRGAGYRAWTAEILHHINRVVGHR